ncbi:MAG: diguanylate cyclase [Tissierellia bacterium]|nr:diguanylate cyclase [Tissierellia bacterium]
MEYQSKYDFYMKFKPIYNKEGKFSDYILTYVSNSFAEAVGINPELILDKKFSEIVLDIDILGFKEFYFNITPKSKIKYELYIKDLERWYLINSFTNMSNYEGELIIYYIDISDIKQNQQFLFSTENKIYYLKDRDKLLYKDKLTGLYNKNFFEEELSRLDTKRQLPISLIMGDINGLKLINDAFGHNMGDRALKKAADIMIDSFRDEDIISRVGGDEFIILLPMTTEETALEIVERVKKKCENNPLEYIKINISFGVATKTSIDEDIDKIYKKAEDRMYFNKLKESKQAKLSMINFLKHRLEKITYETKSHYDRLKELTTMMAEELNLSETEKEELRLLCEFHDIGKIGVSKNILQKEGKLNSEEWENVKRHSEIGYYIAKEIKDASSINELILIHHERWDGLGYPGLLKNDEIPLVARIFAIADAYDVMVNDRPLQSKMTKSGALIEIKKHSGRQFDPTLA